MSLLFLPSLNRVVRIVQYSIDVCVASILAKSPQETWPPKKCHLSIGECLVLGRGVIEVLWRSSLDTCCSLLQKSYTESNLRIVQIDALPPLLLVFIESESYVIQQVSFELTIQTSMTQNFDLSPASYFLVLGSQAYWHHAWLIALF